MFNLLPDSIRDYIKKEYKIRLFIMTLVFIIAIQLSFLVFLFPSWLSSYYKEKDLLAESYEVNKSISSLDIASTTEKINLLNEKIVLMDKLLQYPKFIPLLDDLISLRGSSIRFNNITYTSDGFNKATLSLAGLSERRDSLVSFSDSLKKVEYFKQVDLPISNLAKDRNIDFNISINIEI